MMDHKSQEELRHMLDDAAAKVEVGAIYVHYKYLDQHYKVAGFAILEASDEVAVLYEAQYGEHVTFARALTAWLETVEWEGKTVPRFTKVS